jgi:hypothetical protein
MGAKENLAFVALAWELESRHAFLTKFRSPYDPLCVAQRFDTRQSAQSCSHLDLCNQPQVRIWSAAEIFVLRVRARYLPIE